VAKMNAVKTKIGDKCEMIEIVGSRIPIMDKK
jgi:hypothetical protein